MSVLGLGGYLLAQLKTFNLQVSMIFKSLDMARVPSLWSTRQKSYV